MLALRPRNARLNDRVDDALCPPFLFLVRQTAELEEKPLEFRAIVDDRRDGVPAFDPAEGPFHALYELPDRRLLQLP
jgi:hypothetical protein